MKQFIDRVWEYSLINPEGFTLNIETMKAIKFGISVAYEATQNSFGYNSLEHVLDHALRNGKAIGGWLDTTTDKYYFDSVKIFRNCDIDKAIGFAKANHQLAIFDLTNLREIRIK